MTASPHTPTFGELRRRPSAGMRAARVRLAKELIRACRRLAARGEDPRVILRLLAAFGHDLPEQVRSAIEMALDVWEVVR